MWKVLLSFPVIWAITASMLYGTEVEEEPNGHCNVTLDKKNGGFSLDSSTNQTSFSCSYTIIGTKFNGTVCLFFNDLFLEEGDEVLVYGNESNADDEDIDGPLLAPIKAQNGSVTVVTGLAHVVVVVNGHNPSYIRRFEAFYSHECISPVPPDVSIINSPIYATDAPEQEVHYVFSTIQHMRVQRVFTFLEFNMAASTVLVDGGTCPSTYNNNPPTDFFMNKEVLRLSVTMKPNSTDKYILKVLEVDKSCSGVTVLNNLPFQIKSPLEVLNNGTIVNECRWLVTHSENKGILGLKLDTVDFHSVFDIVAVNDGLSEISQPLLQVTTSNRNISKTQVIRSGSGPNMWISFKPTHYASRFVATVTVHGQGGYMKNKGKISMTSADGADADFLLEVNNGEVVMLTFEDSLLTPPATLSIYDGFDSKNLLATFHGQIKAPVLSRSSRMMVVGTKFSDKTNHFTASFKGVMPGCNQMSTPSTANYILTEKCNSTCTWVIPPQDIQNSELIIYLQYHSLEEGDTVEVHKLDGSLTQLGLITSKTGYVPPIAVPADVGVLINVTQGPCKVQTDKIVLIARSSILPGHNFTIAPKPSEELLISSPLYPDTYPLFTSIQWNVTAPSNTTFFHLAFRSMKLAKNHCVRISGKEKEKHEYGGDSLPDDLFITGDAIVQFDSTNCDKKITNLSLTADTGFQLAVTTAECGQILSGKDSEFSTVVDGSKSVCIWKIDVSDKKTADTVTSIQYSVTAKDSLKNYNLSVHDGASVRDTEIVNNTNSWSRSSVLIVKYTRLNITEPSAVLVFNYKTINCNKSMQCDNNICMHTDWRCNGINECGDYSDERNCTTVPVPKIVTLTGYTSLAFWMCAFAMLLIGVIAGLTAPVCYQKYKDSRYSRFRELSGIDG